MIGNIVGNYKITEKIGEGGMGSVFKGIDLMLEREVAIKVLRPELAGQPEVVERFRAEAVTLAKLNHPKIATLYSFFRHRDDFLMVMEFVRGETLGDVINRQGAMRCEQAIPMFCQALEGIEHAHSLGIIHRDVKPGNVMFTATGAVKVMDFGIARVLGSSRMTRAGHLIGTIEYMSPEQVKGRDTDARSDIYSSGIVLYEMLTGRVPFSSDSEFDLMKSQVEDAPPPLRHFSIGIPGPVEQIVLLALAKNPHDRFESAGEFREALLDTGVSGRLHDNSQLRAARSDERHVELRNNENTPKEIVLASSKEFPVSSNEQRFKGTRLASSGDSSASGTFSNSTFKHERARASGSESIQGTPERMPGVLGNFNWKHYTAAGLVLSFLVISTVALVVALSSLTTDAPPTNITPAAQTPVVSQTPSLAAPTGGFNAETPQTSTTDQTTAPQPNNAKDLGIEIVTPNETSAPADETKSTGRQETSKATPKAASRPQTRTRDSGQRARTDDSSSSASRRAKALRALDQ
ncbi:MAG: protein kinase [Acidobacteriota bacterium]|nr:protein kinase [Acidobacteriota bacterium]